MAGGAKVEAWVHCAATSIRVELSRYGGGQWTAWGLWLLAGTRQADDVIPIWRLYKKNGWRSHIWREIVMRVLSLIFLDEVVKL